MEDLIPILIVLGILFILITHIGHGIWLTLAWTAWSSTRLTGKGQARTCGIWSNMPAAFAR